MIASLNFSITSSTGIVPNSPDARVRILKAFSSKLDLYKQVSDEKLEVFKKSSDEQINAIRSEIKDYQDANKQQ